MTQRIRPWGVSQWMDIRANAAESYRWKGRTLDSVVEELNLEPDFMKIDVEGFEHLALSGAIGFLANFGHASYWKRILMTMATQ